MFLSMDILASDLAQFDPSVYIADADASRGIRYVTPAGSLMLDDPSALYAIPASQRRTCYASAIPMMPPCEHVTCSTCSR